MIAKLYNNFLPFFLKRSKKMRMVFSPILRKYYFHLFGSPAGIQPFKNLKSDSIYEEQTVKNDSPKSHSEAVHKNFVSARKYPKAFVTYLNNGYSTKKGYNLTNKGKLILETSYEAYLGYHYPEWELKTDPDKYEIWLKINAFPQIVKFEQTVASLTTIYQSNYYHWLFDVLPRFHLLKYSAVQPDKYFVENNHRFQNESLKLLGIENKYIINAKSHEYIKAKNLVIPSIPGLPGVVPEWVVNYLRETLLYSVNGVSDTGADKRKNIYISRKKAKHRRIVNEKDVVSILRHLNFEIVFLEEISFNKQIHLFNNADCIISPHGAGLANIVFCEKKTKILELFSPNYVNPCYWNLAQAGHLDYYYLLGEDNNAKSENTNNWNVNEDIVLNISKFRDLLKVVIQEN